MVMRGKWVKVVDSDEWVNTDHLVTLEIIDRGGDDGEFYLLRGETVNDGIYDFASSPRKFEVEDEMNLIMR